MKRKKKKQRSSSGMRVEYDLHLLGSGSRGKYLKRYQAGTNLVLLSPDVAKHFTDDRAVNAALRGLIRTPKKTRRRTA